MQQCEVCGEPVAGERREEGLGYVVEFKTCARCAETLTRAFAGVAAALCQGHGERRERWLAKLFGKLAANGFDIEHRSHLYRKRRTA